MFSTTIKKSPYWAIGYEIVMMILALVILAVLLAEFMMELNEQQLRVLAQIELIIVAVFATDYAYRLKTSKNKLVFVRKNIIDLVAILPVDSFLRVFKIAELYELTHVFKISRFARITAFGRKSIGGFFRLVKTNGLHYMITFTAAIIVVGAFGILHFEKSSESITTFGDALWWSLVTTTTVGYGDLAPVTAGGRILAAFLMLTGIGFLGMVTGSVATFFLQQVGTASNNKSVADEEIDYIKKKLDNLDNLSLEDIQTLNKIIIGLWEQQHPAGRML